MPDSHQLYGFIALFLAVMIFIVGRRFGKNKIFKMTSKKISAYALEGCKYKFENLPDWNVREKKVMEEDMKNIRNGNVCWGNQDNLLPANSQGIHYERLMEYARFWINL